MDFLQNANTTLSAGDGEDFWNSFGFSVFWKIDEDDEEWIMVDFFTECKQDFIRGWRGFLESFFSS